MLLSFSAVLLSYPLQKKERITLMRSRFFLLCPEADTDAYPSRIKTSYRREANKGAGAPGNGIVVQALLPFPAVPLTSRLLPVSVRKQHGAVSLREKAAMGLKAFLQVTAARHPRGFSVCAYHSGSAGAFPSIAVSTPPRCGSTPHRHSGARAPCPPPLAAMWGLMRPFPPAPARPEAARPSRRN